MNITRGKKQTALKVVVYGPEGVGKSTFAAQFPGVVFIDTEDSTIHMDVARTDPPKNWKDLMSQVDWFIDNPDKLGTIAIDTLDWAEKLAIRDVCEEKKIGSVEEIPYGKGYVLVKDRFVKLLDALDRLKDKGVHIVMTAHAQIKKFEQPDELGSYDRFTLKLNEKNVSPLIKEWSDLLLFANFKTDVITASDGKTKKARGGQKRIMYTQHSACWDAKNRFALDDPLPFDFGQISDLFGECAPVAEIREAPQQSIEDVLNNPVEIRKDAPAEVKKTDTLPAAAGAKKGKKTAPAERPPSMQSDNPEKEKLLEEVWKRMVAGGVTDPMVIQAVCADKGYYDLPVPIRDYDVDFIEGCLIEAWDKVLGLALTKQEDLPF